MIQTKEAIDDLDLYTCRASRKKLGMFVVYTWYVIFRFVTNEHPSFPPDLRIKRNIRQKGKPTKTKIL